MLVVVALFGGSMALLLLLLVRSAMWQAWSSSGER
jgi:hypothetical protein